MTAKEFFEAFPEHASCWVVGEEVFFDSYEGSARSRANQTGQKAEHVKRGDETRPLQGGNSEAPKPETPVTSAPEKEGRY